MTNGHVPHQKDETYPWHEWAMYKFGDCECAGGAYEDGPYATPYVEQSDKVK